MRRLIGLYAASTVLCAIGLAACGERQEVQGVDNRVAAARDNANDMVADVTDAEIGEQAVVVFPEAFRGNWDYDLEGCVELDSGTRFQITDTEIKGYESAATLQSIAPVDDLTVRVVLSEVDADGMRTVQQTLALSPVAGIALRVTTDGKTVRAVRCDPV